MLTTLINSMEERNQKHRAIFPWSINLTPISLERVKWTCNLVKLRTARFRPWFSLHYINIHFFDIYDPSRHRFLRLRKAIQEMISESRIVIDSPVTEAVPQTLPELSSRPDRGYLTRIAIIILSVINAVRDFAAGVSWN